MPSTPTLPVLSVAGTTVVEGNGGTRTARFTLTLSQASATAVTVGVATVNGTAFAGSDFTGGGATVTIPAGRTTSTVQVAVTGDTTYEANETFRLAVGNVEGATLAGGATVIAATATIRNDDPRPSATSGNVLSLRLRYGTVYIEMRPDLAPLHVARIKELVGQGFYDNLTFHRVISGFVAQGGDPAGTGAGGSGVTLPAEFSTTAPFVRGTLGMARSQSPDSADSQFFICLAPARFLDSQYTVWGEVIDGMERVDRLARGEPPATPDRILGMTVETIRVTRGTARNDSLYGSAGQDFMMGNAGNDRLDGAAGDDRLHGGAGNDILTGGTGTDTALFSGARTAYTFSRLTNGFFQVRGPDGTDWLVDVEKAEFGGAAAVTMNSLIPTRRAAARRDDRTARLTGLLDADRPSLSTTSSMTAPVRPGTARPDDRNGLAALASSSL